jgi:hypothetical protein
MAVKDVLARVRHDPFANLAVPDAVDQLCTSLGHKFRDRVFTPLVTIRLFVLKILHANTAITHLRHLAGFGFSPGSWCEAVDRLPLALLQGLLHQMKDWAERVAAEGLPPLLGPRVYVVDGSSASMPDKPGLAGRFGLPPGQKPGVGYPVARIMGLLDAVTGLFVELVALPLFTHDLRGAVGLHDSLRPGSILLGDRAFCSVVHFWVLNARGVFGCFRLHQRRKGKPRGLQSWKKPKKCPVWMDAAQFALMPATLAVRIVRYKIVEDGSRTREVVIATTLLDERQWPDKAIADLYGHRWPVETCFKHIKTTLKMDVLKSQTLDGILKELAVYLIAYNLVRLAMLKAARRLGVCVDRVSFIDMARALASWLTGSGFVPKPVVNPKRTGRHNARVKRRRPKNYKLMNKPRAEYRQASEESTVAA